MKLNLFTIQKPVWKQVGPFLGPVMVNGKIDSLAGQHLGLCHDLTGLGPDIQKPDTAFRVKSGHLEGLVFHDKSMLLGIMLNGQRHWWGTPFHLESPFLEVYRSRLGTGTRKLTLRREQKRLVPEGPVDLVRAWDKCLKDVMQKWGSLLGPYQPCGAPGDTLPISPCFPFPGPDDFERDALHIFFTHALTILGVEGSGTLFLDGFRPTTQKLLNPRVEAHNISFAQNKSASLAWLGKLMKHPKFPVSLMSIIEPGWAFEPLLEIDVGPKSGHDVIAAHAYMLDTLGEIPPL